MKKLLIVGLVVFSGISAYGMDDFAEKYLDEWISNRSRLDEEVVVARNAINSLVRVGCPVQSTPEQRVATIALAFSRYPYLSSNRPFYVNLIRVILTTKESGVPELEVILDHGGSLSSDEWDNVLKIRSAEYDYDDGVIKTIAEKHGDIYQEKHDVLLAYRDKDSFQSKLKMFGSVGVLALLGGIVYYLQKGTDKQTESE